MCMPGDNIKMTVELQHADRHGGEPAVRHPRGGQDRRRRRRDQDPSVTGSGNREFDACDVPRLGPRSGRVRARPLPPEWLVAAQAAQLVERGLGRSRGRSRRCGNMSGWNAPRAGTGTTGSRKRPGERTAWSSRSIAGASGSTRRTRNRGRSKSRPKTAGEFRLLGCPMSIGIEAVRVQLPAVAEISYERSSIGRAPVSKTGGWGFDSLRSCCRWRPGRRVRGGATDRVTVRPWAGVIPA